MDRGTRSKQSIFQPAFAMQANRNMLNIRVPFFIKEDPSEKK